MKQRQRYTYLQILERAIYKHCVEFMNAKISSENLGRLIKRKSEFRIIVTKRNNLLFILQSTSK